MTPSTKKIAAREFLFLLGTTLLSVILFIIWTSISSMKTNEISELQNNIEEMKEFEEMPYRLFLFYYTNKALKNISEQQYKDREAFIIGMKDMETSLKVYNWINAQDISLGSKEEFLKKVSEDMESESYLAELILLEKELVINKNHFFSRSSGNIQDDFFKVISLLFIIIFPLRYIYYATRWSINELKPSSK